MQLLAVWLVWGTFVAVNPTIGAALVAAVAGVANTVILVRHERRVDQRLDERRLLVAHLTDDAVLITEEERRELADELAVRASSRRRRRHKRNPNRSTDD